MRPFLFLLPVLLPSCGTVVTQDEIFQQARVELSQREAWSDNAVIVIQHRPDEWHLTWRVSAGSFDYSEPPSASGIRAVPGTERELWFTREGCLLDYAQRESRCLSQYRPVASETEALPPK